MAGDRAEQTLAAGHPTIGDWVQAFAEQRKVVEQGIRDHLSLDERAVRVNEAAGALPEVERPDSDHLQHVADLLEEKLEEMVRVIRKGGDPKLEVRLPPNFAPGSDLELLLNPVYRHERLWLFQGGVQEILYRFRDQGEALILEERNRLLRALASSVEHLGKVVGKLNAHPVVAQAIDAEGAQHVEQTLVAARALVTRYETVLTSREEGVVSLLEDNYYQLQSQFIAACAQLCLQLYGNVSNMHLRELLNLKSIYLLDVMPSDQPHDLPTEAERKRLERRQGDVLKRVMSRAKKESWPTWPILQLYNYHKRFGRALPRDSLSQSDEGLTSAQLPSELNGNPVLGAW